MNKDTSVQTIVVGGVPFTDFVADRTTVAEKTPVLFTDQTLNSPIKWSWDFGDGSTSTTQNPSHSYLLKGIYTVTLTTTNNNGEDTEKKVNYITVGVVPVADFITEIPSYQQGTRMQFVRFIDTSAGNPTSWYWDFGDGQNSSEQFPPLHLYNKDGTYTVSLTVKNVFGENTRIKTNLITVREGPRVDFTADRTRPSVNQFVHFTDLSTGTPTGWNWDFGDGSTASGQNPDHAYRQPGVYSVKLTASDAYTSISHTKRNYITVVITPHADFSADKTKGITPFTVKFTDLSTGSPTGWNWDFGDGVTSREQNPTHIYTTSAGSSTSRYTVTLTATNANGSDEDKKLDYITVTQTPIAEFTVDNREGKAPFIVKFRYLMPWKIRQNGCGNSEMGLHLQNRTPPICIRLRDPMMCGFLYRTSLAQIRSLKPELHPSGVIPLRFLNNECNTSTNNFSLNRGNCNSSHRINNKALNHNGSIIPDGTYSCIGRWITGNHSRKTEIIHFLSY